MIPFISKILRIPDRFVGPKIGIERRVSDSGHPVMLQPVGIKDFLALEIPARGMLLSPVLPEKRMQNWLLRLRRPADYSPEQGARFEVHIEKARTLVGDRAFPFEAMVEAFVRSGRAGVRWVARDLKPPVLYRAAELFRDDRTVRQVADLLGVSRSEAGRLRLRAAADGILGAVDEDESDEVETAIEGHFRLN